MSSTLWLRLQADDVTIDQMSEVAKLWSDLIREVASLVSGAGPNAVRWIITDLQKGSLGIQVVPVAAKRGLPQGLPTEICHAITSGIEAIEREPIRPAHFGERSLGSVRKLADMVESEKCHIVVSNGIGREINLTKHAVANIDTLLEGAEESYGAVEGELQGISIHGKQEFYVYEALNGRRIRCLFDPPLLSRILSAFGKRVEAFGQISRRRSGEKVSIRVQDLRILPADGELPSAREVLGLLQGA